MIVLNLQFLDTSFEMNFFFLNLKSLFHQQEVQKNKWMSTATGQHNFQDQTQKRPTPSNNSTSSASSSTLNQNKQQKHDVRECWKCHRHIERKTFFCSDW